MAIIRSIAVIFAAASALTALSASLPGCDLINKPSELERQIATEQAAIEAYSTQVVAVDALQKVFVAEWKKANELKDLKAYRSALEAQVIPAFTAYRTKLEAMPAGSDTLRSIHVPLVAAYATAHEAFVAFHKDLNEDTLEAGYKTVLAKMDAVKTSEATYLDQLKTYYAKNRVDLVTGK
jgi:hypothetical protein